MLIFFGPWIFIFPFSMTYVVRSRKQFSVMSHNIIFLIFFVETTSKYLRFFSCAYIMLKKKKVLQNVLLINIKRIPFSSLLFILFQHHFDKNHFLWNIQKLQNTILSILKFSNLLIDRSTITPAPPQFSNLYISGPKDTRFSKKNKTITLNLNLVAYSTIPRHTSYRLHQHPVKVFCYNYVFML